MIVVVALVLAFFAGAAAATWLVLLVRLVRLEDVREADPFTAPAAPVTVLTRK